MGKKYRLVILTGEGAHEELYNCIVLDYDSQKALLKVQHFDKVLIFNVTSSHFLAAEEHGYRKSNFRPVSDIMLTPFIWAAQNLG